VVKIFFKDVGQGDSILLEWEDDYGVKIGIIDCNIYNSKNPILDHIIENKLREIEFMILSHPHKDHFSGFKELLNYCRNNNINTKHFYHTAQTTPDYLKSASRSIEGDTQLFELFILLKDMKKKGQLEVYAIDDNPHLKIPLGKEFTMEVLSPSSIEIDKYIRGVKYPFDEEDSTANPNANWLSTVLKIYNDERTVILTSDVESNILSRLGKRKNGRVGVNKISLAQAPHHGSKRNLNKAFWSMRKRNPLTPIVISVGENSYGHPSNEVIDFFNGIPNYHVERTDSITSSKILDENQQQISTTLDLFSSKKEEIHISKDIVYILSGDSLIKK
tara:strand:- start:877 stop:1872 length:996 start_codon:yes stop_codon:yes gene_type:complete